MVPGCDVIDLFIHDDAQHTLDESKFACNLFQIPGIIGPFSLASCPRSLRSTTTLTRLSQLMYVNS